MKILVAKRLASRWVKAGLGETVLYRPELETLPPSQLIPILEEHSVDAVITASSRPGPEHLKELGKATGPPHWLSHGGDAGANAPLADLQALGKAERLIQDDITHQRFGSLGFDSADKAARTLRGAHVSLVGAGIVNLICALELAEHGARLDLYDAAPDPRSRPPWQRLGTTHGGGDARMFCFTEAGSYNEKLDPVGGKIPRVLGRTIEDGGWLAVPPDRVYPNERAWLDRFLGLPTWKAAVFAEDIQKFTVFAAPLWNAWRERHPHLFDEVGMTEGVLALYAEAAKAEGAELVHRRLGSLLRAMSPDELVRRHPACRPAVEHGAIAGGLEIRGFTLNIHRFVERLLHHLERRGVRFHWNHPVAGIDWTSDGRVSGLRTLGDTVRSDHFVLSPGVLGGSLLRGTRSDGALQGVLGLWLRLPHPPPNFQQSIKLHREGDVGEDANIILGQDLDGRPSLILGSGYGFVGNQRLDMASPQIVRLFEALEETARTVFPMAYEAAQREGSLRRYRKACVRPFSATGLGLFEVLSTDRGGRLIVTGGHNTGGFAQAPIVAQAVADTLRGRRHPMQALYDPQRGLASPSSLPGDDGERGLELEPARLQLARP